MLDAISERLVAGSPITVMAQLGLERVLDPSWLDEVFEEYRGRQYERELLFSTVVDSSEDPAMENPERAALPGFP